MDESQRKPTDEEQAVANLTRMPGWGLVDKFIKDRISAETTRLVTGSFADLSEVVGAQKQIQILEEVRHFVNRRLEKVNNFYKDGD